MATSPPMIGGADPTVLKSLEKQTPSVAKTAPPTVSAVTGSATSTGSSVARGIAPKVTDETTTYNQATQTVSGTSLTITSSTSNDPADIVTVYDTNKAISVSAVNQTVNSYKVNNYAGNEYTNSDVANFLPTFTGNVGAGNVNVTGGVYTYNLSSTGLTSLTTLNVSATSNLGGVGNVRITGGSNGQVLTTNGSGNLSWTTVSGGGYGNSDVANYLPTFTGNIGANVVTANLFSGSGANLTNIAAANVSGLGNITTINLDGSSSNVLYGNGVFAAISGGANTGNVTFNDVNIIGDGNLYLQPDSTNAGAALDIYLTTGPDIHIAGNSENLILGRDTGANVMVGVNGNVTIQSDSGTAYTWTFDTTGTTTLPNDTTISNIDVGFAYIASTNGPGGVFVLQDTLTVGIPNPSWAAAIVANPSAYYINFNGGPSGVPIGGITGPQGGTNIYTLTGTWAANPTGFPIGIISDDYANNMTEINSANGVQFTTTSGNWTFGANGTTTFPGSLIGTTASPAPSISGFDNANFTGNITADYFIGNGSQLTGITVSAGNSIVNGNSNVRVATANGNVTVTSSGTNTWTFDTTGNLIVPGTSGGLIKTVSNASIGVAAIDNGTNNPAQLMSFNVTANAATSIISAYASNATIQTNATGTLKTWSFDNAGNLTAPGNIIGIFANGNSSISIPSANGNINISAGGTPNEIVITSTGANINGNLDVANGNITGNTGGFAIGYLNIPQVAASNTTLALTDAGKHYYSTTAGNITLTVPLNSSVGFATGTAISIVVQAAGNVLVNAASGVTLYMGGNATAGNRVVSTYGMATLMKVATNTWFINGTGVA
jgi:hypothetical protein